MRVARKKKLKPRNPVATALILKKGGAHKRRDKRASRARQKAIQREEPI
jgi:hypothetical protein